MIGSPLLSFPLLTSYVDRIINLLISSITSSNCSHGWLSFCSFLSCTSSLEMGRSTRYSMPSSPSRVALTCHSTTNSNFAVSSLYSSASPFDSLASVISLAGVFPSSSSLSLGWYSPFVSNLIYWMCMPCTFTVLSKDSIYSHRATKSMMSSSFSSSYAASSNATVISFSASWLKILSHYSKCSSPSPWENISV